MVGLDVSLFAPEVARILLLRGTSLPPVLWKDEPNRGAKRILDESDDDVLFAPATVVDEQMGAAVRSLLYLWTGWVGECQMFGNGAGKDECLYLSALCERHVGRFTQAKEHFKNLITHPVYEALTEYTMAVTANVAEPSLHRLREMLQQDTQWEPYLFCDAVALASVGRVKQSSDTIIRQIVCREFELLFVHCYEGAIGQKLAQRARPAANTVQQNAQIRERRLREERRRKDEERKRQEFLSQMAQMEKGSAPKVPTSPPPTENKVDMIGVLCPKCAHARQVNATLRGKVTKCPKCGSAYLIPKETPVTVARSAT